MRCGQWWTSRSILTHWVGSGSAAPFGEPFAPGGPRRLRLPFISAEATLYSDCKGDRGCEPCLSAQGTRGPVAAAALVGGRNAGHHGIRRGGGLSAEVGQCSCPPEVFPGELDATKSLRLGNDWADSKAMDAVPMHRPMEDAVSANLTVAMGDARAACRVLAATTLLWPAAAPMIGHARQATKWKGRDAIRTAWFASDAKRKLERETQRRQRQRLRTLGRRWEPRAGAGFAWCAKHMTCKLVLGSPQLSPLGWGKRRRMAT